MSRFLIVISIVILCNCQINLELKPVPIDSTVFVMDTVMGKIRFLSTYYAPLILIDSVHFIIDMSSYITLGYLYGGKYVDSIETDEFRYMERNKTNILKVQFNNGEFKIAEYSEYYDMNIIKTLWFTQKQSIDTLRKWKFIDKTNNYINLNKIKIMYE